MKKGQKKRVWTKEQKLEIIARHLKEHVSIKTLAQEYDADKSMICHWIRDYTQFGDAAFEPKKHSGNPFAALNTGKPLSETERLKLQLLKLEIENERLKKGYIVKGAGANKEFVSLRDLNTK